eukprot:scaffold252947_cov17-Prasinocladus_malaysianus.AAC.1
MELRDNIANQVTSSVATAVPTNQAPSAFDRHYGVRWLYKGRSAAHGCGWVNQIAESPTKSTS